MTRTLIFKIDADAAGWDIRAFVRRKLDLSARVLTALKYEGEILLNGELAHSNAVLNPGDKLSLTLFDEAGEYEAVESSIDVLYEDEDFLVLNKPADMPVHPSSALQTRHTLPAADTPADPP